MSKHQKLTAWLLGRNPIGTKFPNSNNEMALYLIPMEDLELQLSFMYDSIEHNLMIYLKFYDLESCVGMISYGNKP